tara:strand:- start:79 stop:2808 length:2730 start_codon:yes stop_codon:yes gene_type:complete
MSGITRSDLYVRSLKIHNQASNVMEMDLQGNLNLNTKSINSNVKNELNLKSVGNQTIASVNGNLLMNSTNGSVILRNGKYVDSNTLSYSYEDLEVDESNTTQILKPYTTKESVIALRDDSLLIESLNNKSLTLYSNNGINMVSHNSIQGISDKDYIIQANKKINLTSLGFITFNSERLISSIEEDISLFSSTGDILLGGDGMKNNGIKISSNTNNNFVGIGKTDDAKTNLDIEIGYKSLDNNVKNGLTINSNDDLINPEIILANTSNNSKLSIGIGLNEDDINLKIVASKIIIDSKTYIKPLNNFSFTIKDIGKKITWAAELYPNIILGILEDVTNGVVALINSEVSSILSFGYQLGYINRNDFGYVRTQNSNDLFLGTNNKNILNITNSGDIGINTEVPNATLQINNNYGTLFNNKLDKEKVYSNSQAIQFRNGNILVLSTTLKSSNYGLEGFLYNQNNQIIGNFVIVETSLSEVIFSVDNLEGINDLCIIAYCYKKKNSLKFECFFTETNIFKSDGNIYSNTLKNTIEHDSSMILNSFPCVKSFSLIFEGYVLVYNDMIEDDKTYGMIKIFKKLISNNILAEPYNSTLDLYTNTVKLNPSIILSNVIEITSGYLGVEIDNLNNDIIVTYFNKIIDTSPHYHSFLQRFKLSQNKLIRNEFNGNLFLAINDNEQINGTRIKLIDDTQTTSRNYMCVFYKKDTSGKKSGIYLKNIKLYIDRYDFFPSSQVSELNEAEPNSLLIDVPGIDLVSSNNYVISWTDQNNLYYRQDTQTTGQEKKITIGNPNQVFVKCIKNLKGTYKETLLMWNNGDSTDLVNYNSITIKSILSTFNLFNVKNDNSEFSIKNTGELNMNNSLEVDNKNVIIKKNLVITSQLEDPTTAIGVNGQINVFGEKLYIYLNNTWKEFTLT